MSVLAGVKTCAVSPRRFVAKSRYLRTLPSLVTHYDFVTICGRASGR